MWVVEWCLGLDCALRARLESAVDTFSGEPTRPRLASRRYRHRQITCIPLRFDNSSGGRHTHHTTFAQFDRPRFCRCIRVLHAPSGELLTSTASNQSARRGHRNGQRLSSTKARSPGSRTASAASSPQAASSNQVSLHPGQADDALGTGDHCSRRRVGLIISSCAARTPPSTGYERDLASDVWPAWGALLARRACAVTHSAGFRLAPTNHQQPTSTPNAHVDHLHL